MEAPRERRPQEAGGNVNNVRGSRITDKKTKQFMLNSYIEPRLPNNHRDFLGRIAIELDRRQDLKQQLDTNDMTKIAVGWGGDLYDPLDEFNAQRDYRIELVAHDDPRLPEPEGFPDDASHNTRICKPLFMIHMPSGLIMRTGAYHTLTSGITIICHGNKKFQGATHYIPCLPLLAKLDSDSAMERACRDLEQLEAQNARLGPINAMYPSHYKPYHYRFKD